MPYITLSSKSSGGDGLTAVTKCFNELFGEKCEKWVCRINDCFGTIRGLCEWERTFGRDTSVFTIFTNLKKRLISQLESVLFLIEGASITIFRLFGVFTTCANNLVHVCVAFIV